MRRRPTRPRLHPRTRVPRLPAPPLHHAPPRRLHHRRRRCPQNPQAQTPPLRPLETRRCISDGEPRPPYMLRHTFRLNPVFLAPHRNPFRGVKPCPDFERKPRAGAYWLRQNGSRENQVVFEHGMRDALVSKSGEVRVWVLMNEQEKVNEELLRAVTVPLLQRKWSTEAMSENEEESWDSRAEIFSDDEDEEDTEGSESSLPASPRTYAFGKSWVDMEEEEEPGPAGECVPS
ncbi:hypothetical protein BU23DRAFT_572074 [Bimuria novae-zelandiae CBS 107.79]|uniref:Uncharacterized protein n=1 Tax=Bimuria novae-zelandiae CBS 107.79 TaxID=1447943 RepID=A0A6A5UUH8_9PLEO|nr:hypothetical protein BU23DRAFT_572074 [Bimuria novae-zelandiae CBS 107.79]